jgi:hypothetical protein
MAGKTESLSRTMKIPYISTNRSLYLTVHTHTRRGFIALNRLKKDRILIHEANKVKGKGGSCEGSSNP